MTGDERANNSTESADGGKDFVNLEDRGNTLFVRIRRADGGSVPVLIPQEVFEAHFALAEEGTTLAQAYLAHQESINAKALELDPSGSLYSDSFPMHLGVGDFE